ncbi:GAF domain-containing protein [Streptacidiphilus monticola]
MGDYDLDEVLQQALDRLTLLADAGSALASTLDLREALHRVGRIITHRLGDWCCLDVVDDAGGLERACVSHHDESVVTRNFLGALPFPPDRADRPLARVLRGAGPLLLGPEALRPEELTSGELALRQLELFRELGARSAILAPLRSRRDVLGALTVARTRPGPQLEEGDLPLVEDLAHRIALAVDNARLHRSAHRIAERLQLSLLPELPDVAPCSSRPTTRPRRRRPRWAGTGMTASGCRRATRRSSSGTSPATTCGPRWR